MGKHLSKKISLAHCRQHHGSKQVAAQQKEREKSDECDSLSAEHLRRS
jgi:hypothetical protein